MDTPFTELLPELNIQIPNIPNPLALSRIAKAAREFCMESHVYQIKALISLIEGQPHYELRIPRHTEIAAIMRVDYDGHEIKARSPEELAVRCDAWATETANRVRFFYRDPDGHLRVYPIPRVSQPGILVATLALMPTKDAPGLEEHVLRRWEDPILAGAQALLHAMPNKDWTWIEAVPALRQVFESGFISARMERRHGGALGNLTVLPRPLA